MRSSSAARVLLACSVFSLLLCGRMEGGKVSLAWNPDSNENVAGYMLYYGQFSQKYTTTINVGTSASTTVEGLNDGETYYFAVSAYNVRGAMGPDSAELSITVPSIPAIIKQPSSQVAQAGTAIYIPVVATGEPSLTYRWLDGGVLVTGATNSVLSFPEVSEANAGNYTVVVTTPVGCVTSLVATLTVIGSPATSRPAMIGTGDAGDDDGGGTKGDVVAERSPEIPIASAAGVYNGLFYPIAAEAPGMRFDATGLLGQFTVDTKGNYMGTIYLAGFSNSISGSFDEAGRASAIVDRAGNGLANLGVVLNLEAGAGVLDITGVISNLDSGDPWTAMLFAEREVNAFSQPPNFLMVIPPVNGFGESMVEGMESEPGDSLLGVLGDGAIFSMVTPVSADGNTPLFVQLYEQEGLLAGWVNIFGTPSASLLTWICPSSATGGGFTNVVEATITPIVLTEPPPNSYTSEDLSQ
jgi:hypothetical protein